MPTNIYYVYTLTDPRSDKIFYVGKGKGNRWKDHFKPSCVGDNPHKDNIIRKIKSLGLEVVINFPFTKLEETVAYDKEAELISSYGRKGYNKGGILTNVCVDNRPPDFTGRKHSEESKRKMSASQLNMSEETKSKISEARTGKKNF